MSIKPVHGKVLVRIKNEEKREVAGLIIVEKGEKYDKETLIATLVAVGAGVDESLVVGARVIIPGAAGRWVDPEVCPDLEDIYRIVDESDLLAVVQS